MLYKMILDEAGFKTINFASNGKEAIEKIRNGLETPDIIIMDHRMPIVSGLDALTEILRFNKSSKISIKANLKGETFLIKRFVPHFLKKQIKMTYNFYEFKAIKEKTQFVNQYDIEKINLGSPPIWVRIKLTK